MSTPQDSKKPIPISKATLVMVGEWAKQQGSALLTKMEKSGLKESLSLQWPMLKNSWLGGFVSGVQSGFQLGLQSAKKLEAAKTEEVPESDQLELPI